MGIEVELKLFCCSLSSGEMFYLRLDRQSKRITRPHAIQRHCSSYNVCFRSKMSNVLLNCSISVVLILLYCDFQNSHSGLLLGHLILSFPHSALGPCQMSCFLLKSRSGE